VVDRTKNQDSLLPLITRIYTNRDVILCVKATVKFVNIRAIRGKPHELILNPNLS
jgi:hypothetical protein